MTATAGRLAKLEQTLGQRAKQRVYLLYTDDGHEYTPSGEYDLLRVYYLHLPPEPEPTPLPEPAPELKETPPVVDAEPLPAASAEPSRQASERSAQAPQPQPQSQAATFYTPSSTGGPTYDPALDPFWQRIHAGESARRHPILW